MSKLITVPPKVKNLIGTFVFRNEGDNCITGKFVNTSADGPSMECSVRWDNQINCAPFHGKYFTTWIENETHHSSYLEIEKSVEYYELRWCKDKGMTNPTFEGIGMLQDGLLVGAYWDIIPVVNPLP